MANKYRADHVGSFLRPKALLDAWRAPDASPAEREHMEDECILRVLEQQKSRGLTIFTDGEFRRTDFMGGFYASVEGLDRTDAVARAWAGAPGVKPATAGIPGVVKERIRKTRRLTSHEVAFLKRRSPGDIKVTLPSANQFPAITYKKGISDKVYPTYSDYLWDIVPIIRSEIRALAEEGVHYIQIDAPRYSYFIDPKWRSFVKNEMGVEPERALDEAIRADDACLEGIPRGRCIIAIHLCRGNNRSQWYAEGGYDPIAETLFNQLNVDRFLLEYDSERAGTFEPLRFVPPDKSVVLGLISTKVPQMERQDQILRRIEEASRYVPLDMLALSPQCGFASNLEGNLLTEDDQWRKIDLLVSTARKVWDMP